MSFHTRFSPGERPKLECTKEERRTKSEFQKDCDINLIMAKYKKTGLLPQNALAAAARYGDFSQIPSYQEMQNRVIAANELFAALPAKVRKEFRNDPHLFIEASQSEEGRELLKKLGLGKELPPEPEAGSKPPSQPAPASSKAKKGAGGQPAPKATPEPIESSEG